MRRKLSLLIAATFVTALALINHGCSRSASDVDDKDETLAVDLNDSKIKERLGVDDGYAFARGFGRTVSGRAFGHGGAGGQIAWGDPTTGISVGYTTNGFLDAMAIGRRGTAISSLAANCAS